VHKQRIVVARIHDKDAAHRLFDEIGPRYADRNGGYLRILKLGPRPGDNAPMARVDTIGQLVQKSEDDLLAITNFGSKSLEEVIQKLDERGLSLRVKE
ncbi:MAG: large subunit ribosomal protein, partial [Actinomycetota bacterium]|nr:large subunit ribosomal protein [Actinomycetota bacterium]